jgi:Domain of unknown function (DUF1330)
MPKTYLVCVYRFISDPEKVAAYAKLAVPAVAAAGGRTLARGSPRRLMNPAQKRGLDSSNSRAWIERWPFTIARNTRKRGKNLAPVPCVTCALSRASETGPNSPHASARSRSACRFASSANRDASMARNESSGSHRSISPLLDEDSEVIELLAARPSVRAAGGRRV